MAVTDWFRGKSATRPLAKCFMCRAGQCQMCTRVYRARAQGQAVRCRCACRT